MSNTKAAVSNRISGVNFDQLIRKYRNDKELYHALKKIRSFLNDKCFEKKELYKYISKANNKLLDYAKNCYTKELALTDIEEIDTLFVAINFLGQELNYSTVTTNYVNDIFSSLDDIIIVTDEKGYIQYMNQISCRLLGIEYKNYKRKRINEITSENYDIQKLEKLSKKTKPVYLNLANQKQMPVLMKISNFGREDNPMIGHVIIARDISVVLKQQKEIEDKNIGILNANKELKNSEERFRKSIEFSPIPMIIAKHNFDVLYCNRKFTEIFGYLCNDIPSINKWKEKAFPEKSYRMLVKEQWKEDLKAAIKENTATPAREYKIRCKNGQEKIADISIFPESDILIVILNDITERKQAEIALHELNQKLEEIICERTKELEEKNRMLKQEIFLRERIIEKEKEINQQKTQFISMVSHEFRTPVAGIHSGIELIQKYGSKWNKEKTSGIYRDIKHSFDHLSSILEKISDLNRLELNEGIKHEYVELKGLCKNAIDTVKRIYSTGVQIRLSCNPRDISTYSDSGLLRHIIYNVLSNAVKFSNSGNIVNVKLRLNKGDLKIQIEDNGIGIPENELNSIFTMFQRATNAESVGGTGIGLTIVKKCVDLLKGTIHISSIENTGTKVYISIPHQHKKKSKTDEKNSDH